MAGEICANGHSPSKSRNNAKKFAKVMKSRIMNFSNRQFQTGDDDRQASVANGADMSPTEMDKKKSKSKIGRPIIVEDTIHEYPTQRIPAALRHTAAKSLVDLSQSLKPFNRAKSTNRDSKEQKVEITVAECIKPSIRQSGIKSDSRFKVETLVPKTVQPEFVQMGKTFDDSPIAVKKTKCKVHPEPARKNSENENASVSCQNGNLEETDDAKQLPRFYSLRHRALAVLEPDGRFCFHGKLRIRILYGAVRIYGATLNSAKTRIPVEVYSPRTCSRVAIEAIDSEVDDKSIDRLWESLSEQCADRKIAKRLQSDMNNLDDGWAVIELENFDNPLTNFLAANCSHHLFPKIDDPSNHSWRDARRAEIILQANIRYVDSCKQLTIGSRGIDDFADGICYDWDAKFVSRTIVTGGKAVGKSTTARYLVNKLLARSKAVLFIDLDPGQAEFTPAGCVSLNVVEKPLLGPNFTHLDDPHYQIYVGSADITRCFTQYVDAVKKLVDRTIDDPKLSRLPMVVNTMGYCKGMGWDIINYVIKVIAPTDVVQILSKRSKNNFEDTLSRQVIDRQSLGWMNGTRDTTNRDKPVKHRLHVMYSEAETVAGMAESWNLEAHQQRELVMLAYLSKIVRNDANTSALSQRTPIPSINAVPPYGIPFSAVSVALAGAFIPQVLSVMNGNIVALCGIDTNVEESTDESDVRDNVVSCYPRVLTRPPLSTCYGFGILRGVDMDKERLFINTPLTSDVMRHVDCLVGCVNLPLSLLQLNQRGAPYTGTENDLPTSRGSRRGYYRMRYQNDT